MTHSLESLLSKNPNPFAEAMALHVIRTVGEWLPRAFADGHDLEARSRL
ncbi:MAG: iron-containing alcohol dehydrogenase [Chloroflexota bacterium]